MFVSQDVDILPPLCTIVNADGECSQTRDELATCEDEVWSIDFSTSDSGVGLVVVRPAVSYPAANFTVDEFSSGTTVVVTGTYTSNCCIPRVSIVSSDLLGNAGRCDVDYIPITTTTTERATKSPGKASAMTAAVTTLIMSCLTSVLLFA